VLFLQMSLSAIAKTFSGASWKHALAWIGLVFAAAFPSEILLGAFALAITLVIVDSFTGLWAAKRSGEGAKSAKFWMGTMTKITGRVVLAFTLSYSCQTIVALLSQSDTYADSKVARLIAVKLVVGATLVYWILTELVSIAENLEKAGYSRLPKGVKRFLKGELKRVDNEEDTLS